MTFFKGARENTPFGVGFDIAESQPYGKISSKSGFLSSRDVNLIIGFLMKKYDVFFSSRIGFLPFSRYDE